MIVKNNITGEEIEVENIEITPILSSEMEKQLILDELALLDAQVSRVTEDLIIKTGLKVYSATQAIIDRKVALREMLNTL